MGGKQPLEELQKRVRIESERTIQALNLAEQCMSRAIHNIELIKIHYPPKLRIVK